jgi:anion-transporting  ArsA/GET3 family ATPase
LSLKRLYLFTGKGGVGKTTLSIGLTKYLRHQEIKAYYSHLSGEISPLAVRLKIPSYHLPFDQFAEKYLAEKLNSKIIATWICKTPFIRAIFNVLPGLNYLIQLGQIVTLLNERPEMTLVLDSPATGHALTMLEAPQNFQKILQTGTIAEDIERIKAFLSDPSLIQIFICTLPNPMAIQEAWELNDHLEKMGYSHQSLVINNALHVMPQIKRNDLPNFLRTKWDMHKTYSEQYAPGPKGIIPHLFENDGAAFLKELTPHLASLVT